MCAKLSLTSQKHQICYSQKLLIIVDLISLLKIVCNKLFPTYESMAFHTIKKVVCVNLRIRNGIFFESL